MNLESADSLATTRIDLAHVPPFALGHVLVEPPLRKLTAGGQELSVEPKVMKVLVALGSEPDTILSRDDLIESCWDGRIVGDASINRVMSLLRTALRDIGADGVSIETLPKVGYRLLVDHDVAGEAPDLATVATTHESGATSRMATRPWMLPALAVVIVGLLVAGWFWRGGTDAVLPEATIVMLPIEVADDVDPFYAEGLSSVMRGTLASQEGVVVSSGETAAQLVASGREPAEVGRRLGVQYVMTASFDSDVDFVVLNATLLDVADDSVIWRETLRSAPEAAQGLPQRAARSVMRALNRPFGAQGAQLANVDASDYELYLLAMGMIRSREVRERGAAFDILEQVAERNPDFIAGRAGYAKALFMRPYTTSAEVESWRRQANELALEILILDQNSVDALKVAGMTGELVGQTPEESMHFLQRAVEVDPGDVEAWYWLSIQQQNANAPAEEVLASLRKIVELDPLWPPAWRSSGVALQLGRPDTAREFERAILAATVRTGQRKMAEARLARISGDLSEFLRLTREADPDLSRAERMFGVRTEVLVSRRLMGLPRGIAPGNEREALLFQVQDDNPATLEQLAAMGATGIGFWGSRPAPEQLRAMMNQGQYEDIVTLYDGAFGSVAEMTAWAESLGTEEAILPDIASILGLALIEQGRDEEARDLFEAGEAAFAKWESGNGLALLRLTMEARLAASQGQTERSMAALRRAIGMGWPYTVGHAWVADLAPIVEDRRFESLSDNAEFQAMVEPIRRTLAQERRETLALGL